jgi:hypothetical protein
MNRMMCQMQPTCAAPQFDQVAEVSGVKPARFDQIGVVTMGPHPELAELSAAQLSQMLTRGELTSVELVEASLARIAALDEGKTRTVIELNPDALDIARRSDAERRRGRVRGPLHGLPALLKDNIDTGDRMLTTAGSLAMTGAPASRDAPVVARLRRSRLNAIFRKIRGAPRRCAGFFRKIRVGRGPRRRPRPGGSSRRQR